MYNPRIQRIQTSSVLQSKDTALLFPLLLIGGIILGGGLCLIYLADDTNNPFKEMYLMPWVFLVGAVIAAPNVYLLYKKRFNLFHPLVFAAWSFFIPGFFLGGLFLASGLSQPYYLAFVEDERYNLPLTLVYVALGYGGLTLGFFFPYAKNLGEQISRRLPVWKWRQENLLMPGILLLAIGWGNSILAFSFGILGYQTVAQIGEYDGLLYLLTLFWLEGSFLLWMCIFRADRLNMQHYLVMSALLGTSIAKAIFQGNRGSLVTIFFLVACAFVYAAKKIEMRHRVYGAIMLLLCLVVGMIYGTTFRGIKQNESRVGIDEYIGNIALTFDKISDQDLTQTLSGGLAAITERFESVSALAVIVSNYEKMEPYEESYGLKDNIWNDLITAFIPRPIWKDKPVVSDPRKFSDLYFSYGENSYTVTPMGDLLRNFGPIGVPLGMFVLGLILSVIYAALIENQEFSYWRTALFYMLLTCISYEGFYGTNMLLLLKHGTFAVGGLLLVRIFQPKERKTV